MDSPPAQPAPPAAHAAGRTALGPHLVGRLAAQASSTGPKGDAGIPAAWEERRQELVEQLLDALGGLPDPSASLEDTHRLGPRFGDTQARLVCFQALPGVGVPAVLYLPDDEPPLARVLLLCDWARQGKADAEHQRLALELAARGACVLVPEPFGQGERITERDARGRPMPGGGACEQLYLAGKCILAGANILAHLVFEARRAMDLLHDLEVAGGGPAACVGLGPGGVVACLLAAVDERVSVATAIDAIRGAGGPGEPPEWVLGHTHRGVDPAAVCSLAAPRVIRLLTLNGDAPCAEAAEATVEAARPAFGLLGAEAMLSTGTGNDGDRAGGANLEQIIEGLAPRVKLRAPRWKVVASPVDAEELTWGLQDNTGLPRAQQALAQSLVARRGALSPAELEGDVASVAAWSGEEEVGAARLWCSSGPTAIRERVLLRVEEDLWLPAEFESPRGEGSAPGIVWVRGSRRGARRETMAAMLEAGAATLSFAPRGVEESRGDGHAFPATLRQWLMGIEARWAEWSFRLGDPLVGQRVRDTLCAVAHLASRPEVDPTSIYLYGEDRGALWALLAAAVRADIAGVVAAGMLSSYDALALDERYRWPVADLVRGALSRWDVPDVAAGLAPRRLSVVGPLDSQARRHSQPRAEIIFRPAQRAYEGLDAGESLRVCAVSPGEAIADAGVAEVLRMLGAKEGAVG